MALSPQRTVSSFDFLVSPEGAGGQTQAARTRSRPVRAKPSATPSKAKTPPPALDEWRQLWDPAANDESRQSQQTKPVRHLPLPEYHYLKKNHRQNIQTVRLVLEQLRVQILSVEPDQALKIVIGSLRRIDPFVFEELLLHCFKDAGYQVVRKGRNPLLHQAINS